MVAADVLPVEHRARSKTPPQAQRVASNAGELMDPQIRDESAVSSERDGR